MVSNQQVQNIVEGLEAASGISVDADLDAESIKIEDADGTTLELTPRGAVTTTASVPDSLSISSLTVPAGDVMYVPTGEEIGVLDLVVEDTATIVVDGSVQVFGDLTGPGTVTGTGEVTDRSL